MFKHVSRIVAAFLVPCLIVDPVFANSFSAKAVSPPANVSWVYSVQALNLAIPDVIQPFHPEAKYRETGFIQAVAESPRPAAPEPASEGTTQGQGTLKGSAVETLFELTTMRPYSIDGVKLGVQFENQAYIVTVSAYVEGRFIVVKGMPASTKISARESAALAFLVRAAEIIKESQGVVASLEQNYASTLYRLTQEQPNRFRHLKVAIPSNSGDRGWLASVSIEVDGDRFSEEGTDAASRELATDNAAAKLLLRISDRIDRPIPREDVGHKSDIGELTEIVRLNRDRLRNPEWSFEPTRQGEFAATLSLEVDRHKMTLTGRPGIGKQQARANVAKVWLKKLREDLSGGQPIFESALQRQQSALDLLQQGNFEEALKVIGPFQKDAEYSVIRSKALLGLHRLDETLIAVQQGLQWHPQTLRLYLIGVEAYRAMEQPEQAEKFARPALESEPATLKGCKLQAAILMALGHFSEAGELVRHFRELHPHEAVLEDLAKTIAAESRALDPGDPANSIQSAVLVALQTLAVPDADYQAAESILWDFINGSLSKRDAVERMVALLTTAGRSEAPAVAKAALDLVAKAGGRSDDRRAVDSKTTLGTGSRWQPLYDDLSRYGLGWVVWLILAPFAETTPLVIQPILSAERAHVLKNWKPASWESRLSFLIDVRTTIPAKAVEDAHSRNVFKRYQGQWQWLRATPEDWQRLQEFFKPLWALFRLLFRPAFHIRLPKVLRALHGALFYPPLWLLIGASHMILSALTRMGLRPGPLGMADQAAPALETRRPHPIDYVAIRRDTDRASLRAILAEESIDMNKGFIDLHIEVHTDENLITEANGTTKYNLKGFVRLQRTTEDGLESQWDGTGTMDVPLEIADCASRNHRSYVFKARFPISPNTLKCQFNIWLETAQGSHRWAEEGRIRNVQYENLDPRSGGTWTTLATALKAVPQDMTMDYAERLLQDLWVMATDPNGVPAAKFAAMVSLVLRLPWKNLRAAAYFHQRLMWLMGHRPWDAEMETVWREVFDHSTRNLQQYFDAAQALSHAQGVPGAYFLEVLNRKWLGIRGMDAMYQRYARGRIEAIAASLPLPLAAGVLAIVMPPVSVLVIVSPNLLPPELRALGNRRFMLSGVILEDTLARLEGAPPELAARIRAAQEAGRMMVVLWRDAKPIRDMRDWTMLQPGDVLFLESRLFGEAGLPAPMVSAGAAFLRRALYALVSVVSLAWLLRHAFTRSPLEAAA